MGKSVHINNPLSIIAIFAGIAEISGTVVLPRIQPVNQYVFMWFLMLFPSALVMLFFITLIFKHKVLYAPSDYKDESNFVKSYDDYDKEVEYEIAKEQISEEKDKQTEVIQKLLSDSKEDTIDKMMLIEEMEKLRKIKIKEETVQKAVESINSTYEEYRRQDWYIMSNPKSMAFVDEIISSIKVANPNGPHKINYLQSYIALGTPAGDYAWFSPRKTEGMCYIMIWVGKDKISESIKLLNNANISSSPFNDETIRIPSQSNVADNEEKKKIIKQLLQNAYNLSKTPRQLTIDGK
jgi:hypothetical protein